MHTHSGQIQNNNNMKWWQLYIKKMKSWKQKMWKKSSTPWGICCWYSKWACRSSLQLHRQRSHTWWILGQLQQPLEQEEKKKLSQNNLSKTKQKWGCFVVCWIVKDWSFFLIEPETDRERKRERVAALHMILTHSLFFVPANYFFPF